MSLRLQANVETPVTDWTPRRLVVDASCLTSPRSGVGHYTANAVAQLMTLMPETEFHLFLRLGWVRALPGEPGASAGPGLARLARHVPLAPTVYRALRRFRFATDVGKLAPDAVLAPNYMPPAPCASTVPVVYDLSHMRIPEAHPRDRVCRLRGLPQVLARAPAVVTISRFSKSEIVDLLGVAPGKIFVAPPGVGAQFGPVADHDRAAVLGRHGLRERRYFLAIGTLEPRKNLATLIDAYDRLPAAVRARHALVLGGGAGWGDAGLSGPAAERLRRAGELRLLGYIPSADLPALYAGATAFCFPSHYEGFGMPVIEAMACGAAVLASNASAIPEAAGEAGLLFDPRDVAGWTDGLRCIADDDGLAQDLRVRGPGQAAQFTWARTGREIRDALAAAVAAPAAA